MRRRVGVILAAAALALSAGAAGVGDRSRGDVEGGVTVTENRRSFHIGGSPFVVRAFTLSGRWRARLI